MGEEGGVRTFSAAWVFKGSLCHGACPPEPGHPWPVLSAEPAGDCLLLPLFLAWLILMVHFIS